MTGYHIDRTGEKIICEKCYLDDNKLKEFIK